MAVITKISPQKKRQGYYNIFVDGKYALALSELDLTVFGLRVEQVLTPGLLNELHLAQSKSKSYNYALRYLALRPRSIKEVKDYLTIRKDFSIEDADTTIARLSEQNYLNDQDFAAMWVRNRLLLRPKSTSVLRLELIKKGIDNDTITEVLSDLDEPAQIASLGELITKKMRQPKYQNKQKLIEYLSRQGYSYALVKKTLEQLDLFND
ncbi:hypothetical protein EXS53_01575 [Patescibacteria group bacterium]|nr:hypothetical protein [Patescibacteria group bacterium]